MQAELDAVYLAGQGAVAVLDLTMEMANPETDPQ